MKKLWMVLLVLLVIGIETVAAQIWTTSSPLPYLMKITKNQYDKGIIAQVKGSWVFKGNKIQAGETYELEVTFKSNREFQDLDIVIVDGSEKADWWTELSEYTGIEGTIPKDTEISKKFTFVTTKGATGGSNDANQLAFSSLGSPKDATVTLTFSKFTITRVK